MHFVFTTYLLHTENKYDRGNKMVLVFDDNAYRRKKTRIELIYNDLPTKGASYEDWQYYTFPIITVFVAPKPSEIPYIVSELSNKATVPVFVLKKSVTEARYARNVIIDPNLEITPSQIKEIIEREYGYKLKEDIVNHIYISHADQEIYFLGAKLGAAKREFLLIRFFAYNKGKVFSVDDVLEYMHLKVKVETLSSYVGTIAGKCRSIYREDIIVRHNYGYGITHVTGEFFPTEEEIRRVKNKMKKSHFR